MAIYKTSVDAEIDISPTKLAELFADMDENEQAEFLSALGFMSLDWPRQLTYVSQSRYLTRDGRNFMWLLGQYSPNQKAIDRLTQQ